MVQNWTADVFGSTHAYDTDLQNMENNFACLIGNFSGSTAPTSPVAGQSWYDTGKFLLKHRNSTNSAWLANLHGSTLCQVWQYRNDSDEGWTINSSVTDVVLALKGGTDAFNVSGGTTAGSFTLSGFAVSTLIPQIYDYTASTGTLNKGYNSAGALTSVAWSTAGAGDVNRGWGWVPPIGNGIVVMDLYAAKTTHVHAHDGVDRPAAAVGTLQRPDI